MPKAVTITPFGLSKFVRMPFGARNVAQTFQRLLGKLLQDIPFALGYIDDLSIANLNFKSQLDSMSQFTGDIRHVKDQDNHAEMHHICYK